MSKIYCRLRAKIFKIVINGAADMLRSFFVILYLHSFEFYPTPFALLLDA